MSDEAHNPQSNHEVATLGAGCFWCVEACFEQLKGVISVVSGYSGGHVPSPSYEQVCTKTTGHAEVVRVVFNPKEIGYREILQVFFSIHDPTTLNRQGNDIGPQYRSAIFHHNDTQKAVARQLIQELTEAKLFDQPIVTELSPAQEFYPAEDYHQGYFQANPSQGYCSMVVAPKVAKFRKLFQDRLKE